MASLVSLGLASIGFGAIAADGGPATLFAALGLTYQDSCKLMTDDPEITEHYAEEVEDPIVRKQKKGKTTLTFQVMDADTNTLVAVFGGTRTGNGSTATPWTWKAPVVTPNIEQSVQLKMTQGYTILIPRGSVTAKIESDVSRKGIFLVTVTVVAMQPKKADIPPIYMSEPGTA